MKNFVIVTGHCDSTKKIKLLSSLTKQLKKLKDEISLCYCTHHHTIPKLVYDTFDYVIYNRNNPILNWDYYSETTNSWGTCIKFNENLQIVFPQPYHGYAHILSVCDGLSQGVNVGHQYFTMINYDVDLSCVDLIKKNEDFLRQNDLNSLFYHYGKDNMINTEFFSFDYKFAIELYKLRNIEFYQKYGTLQIENIVADLNHESGLRMAIKPIPLDGRDNFGSMSFNSEEIDRKMLIEPKTYFLPYYQTMKEGFKYTINHLPFKMDGMYFIIFNVSSQNERSDENHYNIKFCINDVGVKFENQFLMDIKKNDVLDVYDEDKHVFRKKLNDERHFGRIINNS